MIMREMLLDSLQGMSLPVQGAAPALDEKGKTGNSANSSFGDVLSSTVKANRKSEVSTEEPSARKSQKAAVPTPDNKPPVKTFREIQNKMRHDAGKSDVKVKDKAATDAAIDNKAQIKDVDNEINNGQISNMINCLAQALGVNPSEFRQLLDAAGIAPEELTGVTDVKQLVSKLSGVLGLDADQSKTLGDLLELVKTQVQAASDTKTLKVQPQDAKAQNTVVETASPAKTAKDAPEIEVVRVLENPGTEFSALMARMKLKLNEIRDKLSNNKEGLIGEISLKLKAMLAEVDDFSDKKIVTKTESTEAIKTNEMAAAVETDTKQNTGDSTDAKEGKSESKSDNSVIKPVIEAAAAPVNKDQSQIAVPVSAQIQKINEASPVDKLNIRTPVQAREIINQVLEKAKVVLTGDKSEMVMDLKPDSLGKLSLKVVTEHGMVMAKFVAESQQVKQVLETNMQLLKDSLEKQGMNVQGFSVSVRDDSRQGYNGQNEASTSKRNVVNSSALNTEKLMISAEKLAMMERRNPYSWESSTVNFRA